MLGIGISDLFQWERFVTPTVIKVFYWLAVVISVLLGLAGAVSSLATMAYNPFVGMIFLIASLLERLHGRDRIAHPGGIRAHRVPHQRASRRDPQSGAAALERRAAFTSRSGSA